MNRYRSLAEAIWNHGDSKHKMAEASAVIENLFHELKISHADIYDKYVADLEDVAYEISYEEVEKYLKSMVGRDSTTGMKWDIEATTEAAKSYGYIDLMDEKSPCGFDDIEWFFAMNYVHVLYFDPSRTVADCAKTAYDFLADKNVKNKVAKFLLYMK